jgi:hypothetical protein
MHKHALVAVLGLFTLACDPVSIVRRIFSDQGLQLVRPVRSYIELGGMVMVPKNGKPYYYDRTDTIPAGTEEEPVIKNFSAVIAKESRNNSAGLGVALGALESLIPVPLDAKYDQTQKVEMGQINASGKRLPIPAAQSFIQLAKTKTALEEELRAGGKAILIYEVYSASTLSIKASGNRELNVDLAVGASTKSSSSDDDKKANSATDSGAAKQKVGGGATSGTAPSSSAAAQDSKEAGQDEATKSSSDSASSGISGHWTRKSANELVLEGASMYPFAIRVAEVELGPTGLRLKPGSFRFKGTLGAGTPEERYTAKIARSRELDLLRKHQSR